MFHAYLEQVLLPELRRSKPDAVLVVDNLGAHETPKVRGRLDRSGFLSATCPLLAGSEPDRAGLGPGKAELRRVAARNEDARQRALGPALDRVSAENARAYFRHCGYDRPD